MLGTCKGCGEILESPGQYIAHNCAIPRPYRCPDCSELVGNLVAMLSHKCPKWAANMKENQLSNVSHPKHYNQGKIEVIEFIEDKKLGFHRGNAVKYVARAGLKDPAKEIEDLEKAIWYLRREIELVKARSEGRDTVKPNDMSKSKESA